MIEKMSYVNIMGNMNDIDRAIEHYLCNFDIALEYTEKELSSAAKLRPCYEENPYTAYLTKADNLTKATEPIKADRQMSGEEAMKLIDDATGFMLEKEKNVEFLMAKKQELLEIINKIEPFKNLEFQVAHLKEFEFIRFSFGKMPLANYKQFEQSVFQHSEILFIESIRDSSDVYGVYFTPSSLKDKVDAMFSSLNFERIDFPLGDEDAAYKGTPMEVYLLLNEKLNTIEEKLLVHQSETLFTLGINKQDTINAYYKIKQMHSNYEVRRYGAKTAENFYIFVGWMPKKEGVKLLKAVESDNRVVLIIEDETASLKAKTPTKLKNNMLVKPFEFFVKTYGLPKYNEIDPTPFVAITYILIFGLMFGDLGQGAVICLLGLYLNKRKGLELGGVLSLIGLSAMFFGLLYGSVFGLETIIPALWMKPSEHINKALIMAVGLGVILIITAMVLNLVNARKQHNFGRFFFSPSGVAGLVFYISVIGMGLTMLLGYHSRFILFAPVFIITALLIIAFREPLEKFLRKEKKIISGSIGLFLLETVIELFEVLLTYFTNTVSFVRVGAFALSHAGMMSVVLLLAEKQDGSFNLPVMILGNILVMAMEGLVVGIQVLRIEFYELFSRYYEGGGKAFAPVKQSGNLN